MRSIDADALKAKMFDIPKPKEGATFWDGVDTVGDLIDNAQTIPLPNEQTAWEQGYEAGLMQGKYEIMKGECIKKEDVIHLLERWADGYCYIEIPTDDAIKAIKEMKNGEETKNEKDSDII